MPRKFGPAKKRGLSNDFRTAIQSIAADSSGSPGQVLDTSFLEDGEDMVGMTLRQATEDEIWISARDGDPFVPFGKSLALNVDYDKDETAKLPRFFSTGVTADLYILMPIFRKGGQ